MAENEGRFPQVFGRAPAQQRASPAGEGWWDQDLGLCVGKARD